MTMMTCPAVCRSTVGAAAVAFLLAATHANAQSVVPSADELKSACPQLAGQSIPASSIGLASGAVALASAAFTAATLGSGATPATPDYCKVLGTIAPVDPAAQLIHFQINLPIAWNGKALQYGGGGFNGTLITGLAPLRDAAPGDQLPITRGYVTLGTDSGHQSSASAANRIGEFGLNDEMLQNYAFASYKKVHDVAVAVMRGTDSKLMIGGVCCCASAGAHNSINKPAIRLRMTSSLDALPR
jgi:Tannase and feruloyl esterase